ncbi:MAG: DNA translocase FtsK [Clostridia bacterium]|nr:DNA translocase FtsK [Clostridia bacterium]
MKVHPDEDAPAYNYPPIDLLATGEAEDTRKHASRDMEKAKLLEDTLQSFGISARLTGIAHGPAVTRFELQPAPGIKVSRITSLADDIALNLAAMSVRIEAPIPGKAAVGVEIPNDKVEMVRLRDVLESQDARKHPSRIAVGLGKDNSGRYIVADIAKMPHVLIAGQTGSGKSVCINAIIASILFRASPEEVRLILIDPKVVELSIYNDIPHLVCPVVTDPKKAASALNWAVMEMTKRYKLFAERGVRDIKGYNRKLKDGEKPMPQMVIIIDELADLMMVSPGEVEDSICRLAQLARACGMHLVIATQRPSVNVITGIIKANIPTRIAFSVASQVDSRTMIDHAGAEKLLGNGDMLFVPNGMKSMRVQGAWISDDEVHAIVEHIRQTGTADYDPDILEHLESADKSDAEREEIASEFDPKLAEAVDIVLDMGQASISMLQRRMRIGYARAGRLIDEMAQRGIVSEADGAKPREVLITREAARAMFEEAS